MTNEELKAVKMAWARGEVVQVLRDGQWVDWDFQLPKLRVKPKTININGYDVPAPLTSFDGAVGYYALDISGQIVVRELPYDNDYIDHLLLSRGLCHATREAAELHAKALLSFTSKE